MIAAVRWRGLRSSCLPLLRHYFRHTFAYYFRDAAALSPLMLMLTLICFAAIMLFRDIFVTPFSLLFTTCAAATPRAMFIELILRCRR